MYQQLLSNYYKSLREKKIKKGFCFRKLKKNYIIVNVNTIAHKKSSNKDVVILNDNYCCNILYIIFYNINLL